jgi:hypothetical protein
MTIRPSRLSRAAALPATATVLLLAAAGAAHADQATATTHVVCRLLPSRPATAAP